VRGFFDKTVACPAQTAEQMGKTVWTHELIGGAAAFAVSPIYNFFLEAIAHITTGCKDIREGLFQRSQDYVPHSRQRVDRWFCGS